MKKTTWVIISLSVCVVALSIALVVVITQKKTETTISTELYDFTFMKLAPKPWQTSSSFSIWSDYTKTKSYYFNAPYRTPELDREVDFLGEKVPGIPHKVYMLKRPYQTKEEKKLPRHGNLTNPSSIPLFLTQPACLFI